MPIKNNLGQTRVGVRVPSAAPIPAQSTLMTSIYSVYNAEKTVATLSTGVYAAYNANGNTNDELGDYNGAASGGLTYTTGKIGDAFTFNGTNAKIDFGVNAFNFGSNSFAVSMWFNPTNGNVLQSLLNKGLLSATEKGFNILIDNRYNSNQRGISFAVGGGSGNYQQLSTINQYTIGSWNHIVCIWDSVAKQIKIFLNGVQATTTITQTGGTGLTNITDVTNTSRGGQFGVYSTGFNWYNGRIDATALWNKVLAQDEITALYNSANGLEYPYSSATVNSTSDALGLRNGTAIGGLTYTTGKSGNAFNFNGTTSYVEYGDNFDIGLSSWSYSIWYYPTNLGFSRTLFSKTAWAAGGGRYLLQVQSALIVFSLTLNNGNDITIRDNSSILSGDRWCHITIVVDRNDKINIYYNGILSTNVVNLGTATNNLTPYINDNMNNTRPFRIGCSSGTNGFNPETPTNFVQGRLDEFNIWNRALTASEVTELYNAGTGKQYPF